MSFSGERLWNTTNGPDAPRSVLSCDDLQERLMPDLKHLSDYIVDDDWLLMG